MTLFPSPVPGIGPPARAWDQPKADDFKETIDFLQQLRPGGPWTLTAIVPDGPTVTITATTPAKVLAFVRAHEGQRNIYYSVNPTAGDLQKKATKADIGRADFVHADLDPRDDENSDQAKSRFLDKLETFKPTPTAIVNSGNGIQALWRLVTPVGPEHFADIEAANLAVTIALGGTAGTQNVDRILRLPGTTNIPTSMIDFLEA